MARTNTYTCKTCGKTYERCIKCLIEKPNFDAENFCTHNHADIYSILSKHGCNLISADDALKALSAYNIDEIKFSEDVAAHIVRIKSETTVNAPTPTTTEEKAQQYNKNKKKKW